MISEDDDSVLRAEYARLQAENMALRSALAVAERMIFRYREALQDRLAGAERRVPAWPLGDAVASLPAVAHQDVPIPIAGRGVRHARRR